MTAKRALDLGLGAVALGAAAPVLALAALAMRLTGDRGPFLHGAVRVGEGGRLIRVLKIRTMAVNGGGSRLTRRDDPRITRIGRGLRRFRLDELPQLINVLVGEMSLVGPRPEDPAYVIWTDPLHRRVFTSRPGITGLAQLEFHDEARLMDGPDAERRYREDILPAKLLLDAEYLDHQSLRLDLEILTRTVTAVLGGSRSGPRSGERSA